MRVSQLWNWIYVHGARDFDSMTNLAGDFRKTLEDRFILARPEIVTEQDLHRRYAQMAVPHWSRYRVRNVYIPEKDRGTLCVSSQVGCTLTCRFCHTGTQKLVRQPDPCRNPGGR